jgi:hypothetical protein
MGGLCSKVSAVDKSPSDTALGRDQIFDHQPVTLKEEKSSLLSGEAAAKRAEEQQSFSFLEGVVPGLAVYNGADAGHTGSRTPRLARTLSQKAGLGKTKVRGIADIKPILLESSQSIFLYYYAHLDVNIFFPIFLVKLDKV